MKIQNISKFEHYWNNVKRFLFKTFKNSISISSSVATQRSHKFSVLASRREVTNVQITNSNLKNILKKYS